MSETFTGTEDGDVVSGTFTPMHGLGGNDDLTSTSFFTVIYGDAGNDELTHGNQDPGSEAEIHGGGGTDILQGAPGKDTFFGDGGRDHLFGEGGSDILSGGLGNDVLDGGIGSDAFVFDSKLDAEKNVDRIDDFSTNLFFADSIYLSQAVFKKLGGAGLTEDQFHIGKHAKEADDRIIYDKTTGKLFYDSNGSGKGHEILFAKLGDHLSLEHSDFVVVA